MTREGGRRGGRKRVGKKRNEIKEEEQKKQSEVKIDESNKKSCIITPDFAQLNLDAVFDNNFCKKKNNQISA